ncbi:hypothetical protein AE07_03066 [Enterobacter cloacae BWH 43]|nr:hypothetical protein AE07_03066 [Enterobacter cloacae BWH 43]GJL41592.1 hypothetical protein TUM17577_28010 [Enterobacter asburiae]
MLVTMSDKELNRISVIQSLVENAWIAFIQLFDWRDHISQQIEEQKLYPFFVQYYPIIR